MWNRLCLFAGLARRRLIMSDFKAVMTAPGDHETSREAAREISLVGYNWIPILTYLIRLPELVQRGRNGHRSICG